MIDIRFKTYLSVLYIVAGSLMTASGLIVLLRGGLPIWIIIGPLILATGITALAKPFMTYDIGQASLYVRGPFGNTVRTFGAVKGERIVLNGKDIVRLLPDGRQKKLSVISANLDDVGRLMRYLPSPQQPPAPNQG
ncbi:hypothetical protein [Glycomyces tarimensis]